MTVANPPKEELTELFKDDVGTWFYHANTKQYFRFDDKGEKNGKILGEFLPDPESLWTHRIDTYNKFNKEQIGRNHEAGQKLKCRPETYGLWKHWQEVK